MPFHNIAPSGLGTSVETFFGCAFSFESKVVGGVARHRSAVVVVVESLVGGCCHSYGSVSSSTDRSCRSCDPKSAPVAITSDAYSRSLYLEGLSMSLLGHPFDVFFLSKLESVPHFPSAQLSARAASSTEITQYGLAGGLDTLSYSGTVASSHARSCRCFHNS
jgi:hypothetical protein